jgi:hypothetical protein
MLTDEEIENIAQAHLRKSYPQDCEILSRVKRSEPDGVYFVANRQADSLLNMYIGDGGFFVTRQTGEIWKFGSGQVSPQEGLDYWLKWYSKAGVLVCTDSQFDR